MFEKGTNVNLQAIQKVLETNAEPFPSTDECANIDSVLGHKSIEVESDLCKYLYTNFD